MGRDYLFHTSITLLLVPLAFVLLCFLLPPFLIFKGISSVFRQKEELKGKVVLITGASSGIGEQLAYEYARREACLVIVARREKQLRMVAEAARELGSPQVLPICADVSKVEDCKSFVEEAIRQFGRLDHLVNNAGIISVCPIEHGLDVTRLAPIMEVNFWGCIYPTYFALPLLKKTKGKIIVNSSTSARLHPPRLSIYAASKAALICFYEILRVEHPEIEVTTVTPGFVDSEITRGRHLTKDGVMAVDANSSHDMNNLINGLPMMSSKTCAEIVVETVCRGERNVIVPKWYTALWLIKALCPQLIEWCYRTFYFKPSAQGDGASCTGSPLWPQVKLD